MLIGLQADRLDNMCYGGHKFTPKRQLLRVHALSESATGRKATQPFSLWPESSLGP